MLCPWKHLTPGHGGEQGLVVRDVEAQLVHRHRRACHEQHLLQNQGAHGAVQQIALLSFAQRGPRVLKVLRAGLQQLLQGATRQAARDQCLINGGT